MPRLFSMHSGVLPKNKSLHVKQKANGLKPMPKIKKTRDETKYRLLPQLDAETYAGLKANIALNGIQVPVVKDEDGYILDGFARAKIAKELGYECPSVVVKGLSEQEKRSQVRALNLARRHLDYQAKRMVIAEELRENRDRSNRWIAKSLGVDHKTVASVRTPMGATGDLPPVELYDRGRRQVPTCDQG